MSSVKLIVSGDSCLISSVSLSIDIANKKGLRADLWCYQPNLKTHLSLWSHTSALSSYMSGTSLTYFSGTPVLLTHYRSPSFGTLSYALCRSKKTVQLLLTFSIVHQCSWGKHHICSALYKDSTGLSHSFRIWLINFISVVNKALHITLDLWYQDTFTTHPDISTNWVRM